MTIDRTRTQAMPTPSVVAGVRGRRVRLRRRLRQVITHAALLLTSLIFLLPVLWMISGSLKTNNQIFVFPPQFVPSPVMWSNYPKAIASIPFFTYLRNTILIAGGSVIGTLVSCPPAAYAFARMRWWGRDVYFVVMLATIMLPFISIVFPLYLLFKSWGWIGTLLPLIVPAFGGTPLYIFLLRQFFLTIPRDLSEAATIDGASEFGTFWRVILPLAKPALITVSIFTLMANWTDFLAPLVFLPQESLWTLSLGLQQFFAVHLTAWAYLLATSFVFTLPVLLMFVIAQRLFVQGITLTGLKG